MTFLNYVEKCITVLQKLSAVRQRLLAVTVSAIGI